MPYSGVLCHPDGTTREEFHKILEIRRQALQDATREEAWGRPLPVAWRHGWKAHVLIQGRDKDGSLCFHVVVTGPRREVPYIRKYRLVCSRPLPFELGRG
jgi:hypothetical protein